MELSFSPEKILTIIKRFFLLMIIFAIVFYALGYFLTQRSTSVSYYSYTELYIHTISSSVEDYTKYIDSEAKYVDTYLLTIDTYKFYEELRQQLPEEWRDNVTAGYLKASVSAAKRSESAIIRFNVYTYNADLTHAITQTLSTYMDDYLFNNYRVNSVQLVEEPRPPAASVSQNRYLSLILAAVGVLAAFVIGYVKEMQDIRIRMVSDVEKYGIPILGVVPSFTSKLGKNSKKYAYSGYETYYQAASYAKSAVETQVAEKGDDSKKNKK